MILYFIYAVIIFCFRCDEDDGDDDRNDGSVLVKRNYTKFSSVSSELDVSYIRRMNDLLNFFEF